MSAAKLIYTAEELENAFEFYDIKQMYMCGNHDDNNKSMRHQAWSNDSNLVKSSVEEYYYYLHNYGTVLTFNRDGDIECDFDCSRLPTGISSSVTGSPRILLSIPNFKYKNPLTLRKDEEYCARQECERLRILKEEQARLMVPESERRRLREEREEQERQYMKEREEEMEEYMAWREENKLKPNPEMWKILAMQESAKLQERERLREEEEEEENFMDMPLQNMNDLQIEKYIERIGQCPRDECDEWIIVYNGGDIIRYSYCNFVQWHIEDQTVSNITITRATFYEITFTNYVFDTVIFEECVFMDIVLNNTTFKNCTFIDCNMDSSMSLDNSCKLIKHNEYDHYYARDDEDDYDDEDDRQVYEDLY